jgi:hypothetical protein
MFMHRLECLLDIDYESAVREGWQLAPFLVYKDQPIADSTQLAAKPITPLLDELPSLEAALFGTEDSLVPNN